MTIPARLTAEAVDLVRAIVLDLDGVPVYIRPHPADRIPPPRNTGAYCLTRDDHAQELVVGDAWQGQGVAVVFVEMPRDRLAFLGAVVHEIAHALPLAPAPAPTPAEVQERSAGFSLACALAHTATVPYPWYGHGADFTRTVLHLHHRALWTGLPLPLVALRAAGPRYGLSPLPDYLTALRGEPWELRSRTFAEIDKEPPPAEFAALFASDVAAWHDRHPNGEKP